MLRGHRRRLIEQRLANGLGRLGADDLLFPMADGSPYPPHKPRDWGHAVRDRKLPGVSFHALRHSHASALIAAGLDIVTISRRLGHASSAITLRVYASRRNSAAPAHPSARVPPLSPPPIPAIELTRPPATIKLQMHAPCRPHSPVEGWPSG